MCYKLKQLKEADQVAQQQFWQVLHTKRNLEHIFLKRNKKGTKNILSKASKKNEDWHKEEEAKYRTKEGKYGTEEKKIKRVPLLESSSESDEDPSEPFTVSTYNEDSECPFCNQLYSTDSRGEQWIICTKCHISCHEQCFGASDYKPYVCDFCLNS